jgi:hypothetical protein
MAASHTHILPMHSNGPSEYLEPQAMVVEVQSPELTGSALIK